MSKMTKPIVGYKQLNKYYARCIVTGWTYLILDPIDTDKNTLKLKCASRLNKNKITRIYTASFEAIN